MEVAEYIASLHIFSNQAELAERPDVTIYRLKRVINTSVTRWKVDCMFNMFQDILSF